MRKKGCGQNATKEVARTQWEMCPKCHEREERCPENWRKERHCEKNQESEQKLNRKIEKNTYEKWIYRLMTQQKMKNQRKGILKFFSNYLWLKSELSWLEKFHFKFNQMKSGQPWHFVWIIQAEHSRCSKPVMLKTK